MAEKIRYLVEYTEVAGRVIWAGIKDEITDEDRNDARRCGEYYVFLNSYNPERSKNIYDLTQAVWEAVEYG